MKEESAKNEGGTKEERKRNERGTKEEWKRNKRGTEEEQKMNERGMKEECKRNESGMKSKINKINERKTKEKRWRSNWSSVPSLEIEKRKVLINQDRTQHFIAVKIRRTLYSIVYS